MNHLQYSHYYYYNHQFSLGVSWAKLPLLLSRPRTLAATQVRSRIGCVAVSNGGRNSYFLLLVLLDLKAVLLVCVIVVSCCIILGILSVISYYYYTIVTYYQLSLLWGLQKVEGWCWGLKITAFFDGDFFDVGTTPEAIWIPQVCLVHQPSSRQEMVC